MWQTKSGGDPPTQSQGQKSARTSTGGTVITTTVSLHTFAQSASKHTPHHHMIQETGGSTRQYHPG